MHQNVMMRKGTGNQLLNIQWTHVCPFFFSMVSMHILKSIYDTMLYMLFANSAILIFYSRDHKIVFAVEAAAAVKYENQDVRKKYFNFPLCSNMSKVKLTSEYALRLIKMSAGR